jgi:hypothetical protein
VGNKLGWRVEGIKEGEEMDVDGVGNKHGGKIEWATAGERGIVKSKMGGWWQDGSNMRRKRVAGKELGKGDLAGKSDIKTGSKRNAKVGGKSRPGGAEGGDRFEGGIVGVEDGFWDRRVARVCGRIKEESSNRVRGTSGEGRCRGLEVNASREGDTRVGVGVQGGDEVSAKTAGGVGGGRKGRWSRGKEAGAMGADAEPATSVDSIVI